MSDERPSWWPCNPYPETIFCSMTEDKYDELVPDPGQQTALSGFLGRLFWGIASDSIFAAMTDAGVLTAAKYHGRLIKHLKRYNDALIDKKLLDQETAELIAEIEGEK